MDIFKEMNKYLNECGFELVITIEELKRIKEQKETIEKIIKRDPLKLLTMQGVRVVMSDIEKVKKTLELKNEYDLLLNVQKNHAKLVVNSTIDATGRPKGYMYRMEFGLRNSNYKQRLAELLLNDEDVTGINYLEFKMMEMFSPGEWNKLKEKEIQEMLFNFKQKVNVNGKMAKVLKEVRN